MVQIHNVNPRGLMSGIVISYNLIALLCSVFYAREIIINIFEG